MAVREKGNRLIPGGRPSSALRREVPFSKNLLRLSSPVLLLCLVFASFPALADEEPGSFNFWPLFQYASDPEGGVKEIDALGPLFTWKREDRQNGWGIRPLFYWTEKPSESLERLEYLYPFGKYQDRKGEEKGYFFLLHRYKKETIEEETDWDFQLFPFFMGESKKGEDYWGVFPLFGNLFNRYGRKEIRFILWPLYSRSVSEGYTTTNVLWPFYGRIEGEKRGGYRLWPLYGYKEEFGVSKLEFYLWPIFFRGTKGLDLGEPVEEKIVFPFYVSSESERFEKKTVIWPFFSRSRNRLTGLEQWDIPYPIFRYIKGEEARGTNIFPLYGYEERRGGMKKSFLLYPLLTVKEIQIGDVHEKTVRILLISRIRSGKGDQAEGKGHSIRIWPFFDYERSEKGEAAFSAFYLIPYKEEGLERNLFPLFRIFQWETDPRGNCSTRLLWGLYKQSKRNERKSWEIAHLMRWSREGNRETVSFLHGLFQYTRNGPSADLRIFFLPLSLRGGREKEVN